MNFACEKFNEIKVFVLSAAMKIQRSMNTKLSFCVMQCLPLFIHKDRTRGMSSNPHIPEIEGQIRNERNDEMILQFIIMDAYSVSNIFTNFLPEKLNTVTEMK
jgi:hypothetical protein